MYENMDEEFISAREYEDATRTVVRTIGRAAKCDVVFTGDQACIGMEKKSKIVFLPANDPAKPLTKRQYHIGQGFANHETLHSLCTDLEGVGPKLKQLKEKKQHLTWALAQGIEDVRIEHAGQKLYPGIPRKLDATTEFAAQHFLKRPKEEQEKIASDFKKVGPLAITWAGRKKLGYNAPSLDECLKLVPEDIRKKIDGYVDEVLGLATGAQGVGDIDRDASFKASHEVIEMAKRIADEIGKHGNKGSSGGSASVEGEGGGQGKGNGKGKEGKGGHGPGMSGELIPQDETEDPNFLLHVGKELENKRDGKRYTPYMTAFDVWVNKNDSTAVSKQTFGHEGNLKDYSKTKDKMTGKLAVMSRKLERALQVKMSREYTTGHPSGQIDVRKKGTAIIQGKQNVFRRKSEGKDIDTAVTLLVDASGSMDGTKIKLAQQACIALAESIARLCPLEILVFNTRTPHKDEVENYDDLYEIFEAGLKNRHTEEYSRYEGISMYDVKSFDTSMSQARIGMGAINKMVASANADGESLLKAWDRLKKRPEKNKVLIVLSDGEPACAGNQSHLHTHLRDVVELIGVEGGNCVGIGIQSDAVKRFYPKYSVVESLDELSGTTLDNVARLLLGERFQIDNGLLETNKQKAREARL